MCEAQREREVHMLGLLAFDILLMIFFIFRSRVSRISCSLIGLHVHLTISAGN